MEALNMTSLAENLRGLQADGVTFKQISDQTGISRTVISQLANRGLAPSAPVAAKLWQFVEQAKADPEDTMAEAQSYKQSLDIYDTEEYVTACGWCSYIMTKRKMGVLIGPPGCGKTTILRHMLDTTPAAIYIEAMPNMRVNDLLRTIAAGVGTSLTGNSYQRLQQLIEVLRPRKDVMLLIDEAEYLKKWDVDKFEYLRKIWDNSGTPIVMAGTPELEQILTKGAGRDNLAQLYRRKYELQLKGITTAGAKDILRHYNITTDAAEMLAKIGADAKHGGMGNMVEILELCLDAAAGGEITGELVTNAKRYKLMW